MRGEKVAPLHYSSSCDINPEDPQIETINYCIGKKDLLYKLQYWTNRDQHIGIDLCSDKSMGIFLLVTSNIYEL